jgi:hypothetical protein|tara:strand:+ start:1320 stop:1502 length:183 start_codon:yes stop_codon:yes gene_type:complete
MAKITDIYGKVYKIPDMVSFLEHIERLHTFNGIPDNSIHEENGYFFRIDKEFFSNIKNLK